MTLVIFHLALQAGKNVLKLYTVCHLYSEISGHRWIGVYFCTDLHVPQWMSFNGFGDPLSSSTTMRLEFVVQNCYAKC